MSHSPAGRLRALGSSRASPGPLSSLTSQLSTLLSGPTIIGTMCLVKLFRQWKVPRFSGRCVPEAGPGPADGGFPSPVPPPSLPPLATGQQKEAASLLLPFGRTSHGCRAATSAPAWLR